MIQCGMQQIFKKCSKTDKGGPGEVFCQGAGAGCQRPCIQG